MKVEIINHGGIGQRTEVYFDGQKVPGITHLSLEIPADGVVEMTVTRHLMDNGRPVLKGEGESRKPIEETLRFTGEMTLISAEAQ